MKTFDDLDPSTGRIIATIEAALPSEVRDTILSARQAHASWAQMPFQERAERLTAGGEALLARAAELAGRVTEEMGKPASEAHGEASGWASSIPSKMKEVEEAIEPTLLKGSSSYTTVSRDPYGVVAAITPWNFPVGMPIELVIPALAVGNTVVFKPSEHVPIVGALIHECFNEYLPPGVFSLLQGGGEVGAQIVGGGVDFISFIGSQETGRRIMAQASACVTPVLLELGGKDPMLVFADADLDAAAEVAVGESLRNAGQICNSIERVYVAEEVAESFEALVLERARNWSCGTVGGDLPLIGPMVSATQREKVVEQVKDAVERGARLLLGGDVPDGPGFFFPPTVLADVPSDSLLLREETFGPVVCLAPFSGDEQEAIELANNTEYGLCATIYSADIERAQRVAEGICCGQLGINRYLGDAPGAPWVGRRQSGVGFLCGLDGVRQFTVPKSISVPINR